MNGRAYTFAASCLISLSVAACGGGAGAKAGAKTPGGPAGSAAPADVATTPGGQQFAASDAPSSGNAGAPRPQMNAAAAQAYQAGLQAFQAGDLQGAKTQFARAVDADSNVFQAQFSLGVVLERLGAKSPALSAYRAAFGIVKDYEPAIAAYALLLARSGDLAESEDFLNRQRAVLADSAALLAALAEVKSIRNDSSSAQQLAQEALKKNPDYKPAMVTLARDHYRSRRLDLALYTLTAILSGYGPENPPRDKDNAEALLLRGLIYKEQGRRRDAFADFQRANQLRPDLLEAKINLAKYMLEAGNATEAVPLLENALGYDAGSVIVHLNLGDAYRLQGRTADAMKHLDWVVAKEPASAEVHYNLALLYLFSRSIPNVQPAAAIDKAIAELEKFKAMRPRTKAGAGDDVDELLNRAKNRKAILAAEAAQPPPEPTAAKPPADSKGVAPAAAPTGGKPAPGAAPAAGAAPAQPGGAAPAQPGGATPAQPGGAAPAQPGGAVPAKPGGAAPTQPAAPAKPGAPAPAPSAAAPAAPAGKGGAASAAFPSR